MFIYNSGVKVFTVFAVCTVLFLSLTCSFLCFPPSAHSWQFARHGDKISEKKEQNVRIKTASFVFVIVLLLFSFFPVPTDFSSRRE